MTEAVVPSVAGTAKDEAVQLLRDIVARLSGSQPDIASALRTALHVCNLMGWSEAADWFLKEINGYEGSATVPPHRSVAAYGDWRPYTMRGIIEHVVKQSHGLAGASKKTVPWLLTEGIDTLIQYAQHGVIVQTGQDEDRWSDISKKTVNGRFVTVVDAQQASYCVQLLRNIVFGWASKAYSASRVGDLISDIWAGYRGRVDEALVNLNLGEHLDAIQTGLTSTNSQDWRQAMYGIRDVLRDLAKSLWLAGDETYPHITNDKGQAIRVTEKEYVNRLWAYLHQEGVRGRTGQYLSAELRRLHALDDLASKAHGGVSQDELRLAVVAVYTVIGEIVYRTDMQPVAEVHEIDESD